MIGKMNMLRMKEGGSWGGGVWCGQLIVAIQKTPSKL